VTRRRVRLAGLLAVAAVLAGCGGGGDAQTGGTPQREVRIAAASDLKFALEELQPLLDEQHPGVVMRTTYGSSGTFLQQLSNGAPFDVFLSADLAYPQQLAAQGLAAETDVFPYAVGRLVVWTPEGSAVDPARGLDVLTDPEVRRVAVANPQHAPYGRAAVAALRSNQLYDAVQPKLVLGESVSQAAEFVQSGSADAGIVAMSLVLSDPLRDQGRWVEVPLTDFPALLQGGVVLAGAQDPTAARAVRDTLLSESGRALLRRYGFSLPDSAR
jgi:molybdate transport system substrate-binding protein